MLPRLLTGVVHIPALREDDHSKATLSIEATHELTASCSPAHVNHSSCFPRQVEFSK